MILIKVMSMVRLIEKYLNLVQGTYLAEHKCDVIAAQASYHHRRHCEDEVAGHRHLKITNIKNKYFMP